MRVTAKNLNVTAVGQNTFNLKGKWGKIGRPSKRYTQLCRNLEWARVVKSMKGDGVVSKPKKNNSTVLPAVLRQTKGNGVQEIVITIRIQ